MTPRRILLPFCDDSTLFFVISMRRILAETGYDVKTAWLTDDSELTYRQLAGHLPEGPDILLQAQAFRQVTPLLDFDAIVTSRIFAALRDMMRRPAVRYMAGRPCVIAFQGGLEFMPETGFANRLTTDATFIVPSADLSRYQAFRETREETGRQYVGFGHPIFLHPDSVPKATGRSENRDVYFFAQAISPPSRAGRAHLLRVLAAIARRNPDRTVWIKLRHLPHENLGHLHRELYDYPSLLKRALPDAPGNLKLTACSMDDAVARAAVGLTCTSTAAIDLVRAGVPTLIYLDYVENYLDPLMPPMRRLFKRSGLVAGLEEVLDLRAGTADSDWLAGLFVASDRLVAQIGEALAQFEARPVAVATLLPPLQDAVPRQGLRESGNG